MIGMEIKVSGEYQDFSDDTFKVRDLTGYDLSSLNFPQLIIESLYLTYCANELENRADAMYTMIQEAKVSSISLEMIM